MQSTNGFSGLEIYKEFIWKSDFVILSKFSTFWEVFSYSTFKYFILRVGYMDYAY